MALTVSSEFRSMRICSGVDAAAENAGARRRHLLGRASVGRFPAALCPGVAAMLRIVWMMKAITAVAAGPFPVAHDRRAQGLMKKIPGRQVRSAEIDLFDRFRALTCFVDRDSPNASLISSKSRKPLGRCRL